MELLTGLQHVVEIVSTAYHSTGLSSCSVCSVNHYRKDSLLHIDTWEGGGGGQRHRFLLKNPHSINLRRGGGGGGANAPACKWDDVAAGQNYFKMFRLRRPSSADRMHLRPPLVLIT